MYAESGAQSIVQMRDLPEIGVGHDVYVGDDATGNWVPRHALGIYAVLCGRYGKIAVWIVGDYGGGRRNGVWKTGFDAECGGYFSKTGIETNGECVLQ